MAEFVEEREEKGAKELNKQAAKGMELLAAKMAEPQEAEGDKVAAQAFKDEQDKKIAELKAQVEALTGKDNKKQRTAISKEASALGNTKEYIDAERVLKGKPPVNGFFLVKGAEEKKVDAAPAKTEETPESADKEEKVKKEKDDKKPKKVESTGISRAERDELEKLKNDIITLKKDLKEQGMSGGQMNKDERVVTMVTRMNELKEKECPGSTAKEPKKDDKKKKKMSADQEAELEKVTQEVEEYRMKLQTEFKYSKKEIAADPDMVDLLAKLKTLQGKK